MTLYWWSHWFWITTLCLIYTSLQQQQFTQAMPIPFSSLETISTSLKSALIQNENSFQQTNDEFKIASGSKSVGVPLPFETSDTDDLFDGASEVNAENVAKTSEWLSKPNNDTNSEKPKLVAVNLDKSEHIPNEPEILKSFTLSNVNSTNANNSSLMTTVLTSVTTTESNAMSR